VLESLARLTNLENLVLDHNPGLGVMTEQAETRFPIHRA
jgi:hypothetical protein